MTAEKASSPRRRPPLVVFSLFVAALVLTIASMGFGFSYENGLRREIARSLGTHNHMQSLFSEVQKAETSQRSYLLKRNPADLRFYGRALQEIAMERAKVASPVAAQPGDTLFDDLRRLPGGGPPAILYTAQDLCGPPPPPVRAVLIKSRSDLTQLARVARKLLASSAE